MNVSVIKRIYAQQTNESLLIKILTGLCFLTLLAKVSIPLPFTPVPITFQTYAIYTLGLIMSPRTAIYTVISYLFFGMFAPVFCGNSYGFSVFCGPTGGYLFMMVPAVAFISFVNNKYFLKAWQNILLLSLTASSILFFGSLWLSGYLYLGTETSSFDLVKGLVCGAYPFLIGEAIKIGLAVQSQSLYSFCKQRFFN